MRLYHPSSHKKRVKKSLERIWNLFWRRKNSSESFGSKFFLLLQCITLLMCQSPFTSLSVLVASLPNWYFQNSPNSHWFIFDDWVSICIKHQWINSSIWVTSNMIGLHLFHLYWVSLFYCKKYFNDAEAPYFVLRWEKMKLWKTSFCFIYCLITQGRS